MPSRGKMRTAAATFVCCLTMLLLTSCGRSVEPGEARLCRRILPGLEDPDAKIDVLRIRSADIAAVGSLPPSSGVEIHYAATAPHGGRREHRILCRFDIAHGAIVDEGHLIAVETEAGPLPAARLYMLKRFWLASPEGQVADPEPVAGAAQVREVPRWLALGLQMALAGMPQIAVLGMLTVATALIYGLVGRVNLALGDIGSLGGYGALLGLAAAGVAGGRPWQIVLALLLALALALWTAGIVAAWAGWAIFEPLSRRAGQTSLIASAGLAVVLSEAVRLLQGSGSPAAPALLNQPHAVARSGRFIVTATPMALTVVVVGVVVCGLLLFVMQRSRFGLRWRAVADDGDAAALLGIDRRRLHVATFALAGLLAGLAGALMVLSTGSVSHGTGLLLGLKAVMAAILGGLGSLPGALCGAVLIGLVELVWAALVSIEHREAAVFVLLSALLVLRPGGLLGRPDLERDRG